MALTIVVPTVLAADPPPDVYLGLALMAVVLVAGVVMTAMVFVRNRRPDPPDGLVTRPSLESPDDHA